MIYFTSDLHLNHDKEFCYGPRGFSNVLDMNKAIIDNWNNFVKDDDIVYLLGDVVFGDLQVAREMLSSLKGSIKLILGNHDGETKIELYKTLPNIEILGYSTIFTYKKYHFYLSHYPTLTANYDDEKPLKNKVINLCGHVHTKDPFYDFDKGLIFHVEVDTNNCTPWNIDDIISLVSEKYEETIL